MTEDTLIPRADTETLVDSALAFVNSREKARVLDLCCGTGCVGISIARFARNPISCLLADISEKALKVAKENTAINRVTGSVGISECDATKPCPGIFGTFDLIVCNPPYIPTDEIPTLDIEVQNPIWRWMAERMVWISIVPSVRTSRMPSARAAP